MRASLGGPLALPRAWWTGLAAAHGPSDMDAVTVPRPCPGRDRKAVQPQVTDGLGRLSLPDAAAPRAGCLRSRVVHPQRRPVGPAGARSDPAASRGTRACSIRSAPVTTTAIGSRSWTSEGHLKFQALQHLGTVLARHTTTPRDCFFGSVGRASATFREALPIAAMSWETPGPRAGRGRTGPDGADRPTGLLPGGHGGAASPPSGPGLPAVPWSAQPGPASGVPRTCTQGKHRPPATVPT